MDGLAGISQGSSLDPDPAGLLLANLPQVDSQVVLITVCFRYGFAQGSQIGSRVQFRLIISVSRHEDGSFSMRIRTILFVFHYSSPLFIPPVAASNRSG